MPFLLPGRKRILARLMGVVGERRWLLRAGQLRQFGDGCLVIIDPGAHHVRGSFGTQVIADLARALLLAGLRPPILDPDAGRLLRCIAKTLRVREEVLPPGVLQRPEVLAYLLRLHGVGHDDHLVAVVDEDIAVFPHPRTLLLVKRRDVTRLRQGDGRFPYFGDDLLSGGLVRPHGDTGQGNDEESHGQKHEDLAVFHTHPPSHDWRIGRQFFVKGSYIQDFRFPPYRCAEPYAYRPLVSSSDQQAWATPLGALYGFVDKLRTAQHSDGLI